jgi:hypothetical protein
LNQAKEQLAHYRDTPAMDAVLNYLKIREQRAKDTLVDDNSDKNAGKAQMLRELIGDIEKAAVPVNTNEIDYGA